MEREPRRPLQIYCPRCGYEGVSRPRAFTLSLFPALLITLMGVAFGSLGAMVAGALLGPLGIFLGLVVVGAHVVRFLYRALPERICPRCGRQASDDLATHRARLAAGGYTPPHLVAPDREPPGSRVIPWR